jgi:hypothetical protein
MEHVATFFGHLELFTLIWYILWPFGNLVVIWHIYEHFGIHIVSSTIWQPCISHCDEIPQWTLF